jgi:hypothetical protein
MTMADPGRPAEVLTIMITDVEATSERCRVHHDRASVWAPTRGWPECGPIIESIEFEP